MFEKVIEALVAKQIYHRNLQQLEHYAKKDCFIEDVKEFESMISFYHDMGTIIKHRNTVVLKTQWLIDLFKQLITIPPYNKQVGIKFSSEKGLTWKMLLNNLDQRKMRMVLCF